MSQVYLSTPKNNTRAIILLSFMIIGWVGILFAESTRPPAEVVGLIPQLDKVAHFAAFSVLGLLVCGLSLKVRPRPSIPLFSLPLLVVSLCGVLEECLQLFVPGRMASIPDLLADMAGAIFAILLVNRIWKCGKVRSWGVIGSF
ncbi:MAG: VanZ family protein [Desulfobulbaceae bacterium]|nr:VanZ family protein [Desulfobulbaceae bacterium]HIJ91194.1 VanZ family protein [Deltaproteobacteria bacterium]